MRGTSTYEEQYQDIKRAKKSKKNSKRSSKRSSKKAPSVAGSVSKYSKYSKNSRKSVRRHRPRFEGESTYDHDFKNSKPDMRNLQAKDIDIGTEERVTRPKFEGSTMYNDQFVAPKKDKSGTFHANDPLRKKKKSKRSKKPALETSTVYK
jgi:hypothetical protein